MPFDSSYISLLSEMSVRKKQNIVKAFLVGLKSYFVGCRDTKRGSSILYVFKKNQWTSNKYSNLNIDKSGVINKRGLLKQQ